MGYLNKEYCDRGMKKWAGFLLSEHTAVQKSLDAERKHVNRQKEQMDTDEIASIINDAILKNKTVAIQIEAVDGNGNYSNDIVGIIAGSDEMGIYIGDNKVNFDEIRNVEFISVKKWTHLDE